MTLKVGDAVTLVDDTGERTALVWTVWPKPGGFPSLNLVFVKPQDVKSRLHPDATIGRIDTFTEVPHVSAIVSSGSRRYWRPQR